MVSLKLLLNTKPTGSIFTARNAAMMILSNPSEIFLHFSTIALISIPLMKSSSGYSEEIIVYEYENYSGCPYKDRYTKAAGNRKIQVSNFLKISYVLAITSANFMPKSKMDGAAFNFIK